MLLDKIQHNFDIYAKMNNFESCFRYQRMSCSREEDKEELDYYIGEMEAETPFSAWGFYSVQKTTLIDILSTVITYILILIQMNIQTKDSPIISE